MTKKNIAIIGASGSIGNAFIHLLSKNVAHNIYAFSRSALPESIDSLSNVTAGYIDYTDEKSLQSAAQLTQESGPLDLVIITTGFLHDKTMMPEKSLRELSHENFHKNFLINVVGPALVAKHFLPKLHKNQHSVFSILSARVGSISDNKLGGWYAYRASKAALNMFIKTTSIEVARKQNKAIIVGLHPGTVDSELSLPFQKNVIPEKLFTPEYSAKKLLNVILTLEIQDSGKVFAWDGKEIPS